MRRYKAKFIPQAWINDYAFPIDPEGEIEWDCTTFVTSPPAWCERFSEAAVQRKIEENGYFLDADDVLKNDPTSPEWVRRWRGPFTITVEYDDE